MWAMRTDLALTFYGGPSIVYQDSVFFGARVLTGTGETYVTLAKMKRTNGELIFYKSYTKTGATATVED